MSKFEILPGLPATGPLSLQFTSTGHGVHREGLVVRFFPGSSESWVGNFQPGLSSFDCVVEHSQGVLIIAGGEAYLVDPDSRELLDTFGGQIESCEFVERIDSHVLGNGLWFLAYGKLSWQSRRISWDGMSEINISGARLTGQAYSPFDDSLHPFELDLLSGNVSGGSYNEQ